MMCRPESVAQAHRRPCRRRATPAYGTRRKFAFVLIVDRLEEQFRISRRWSARSTRAAKVRWPAASPAQTPAPHPESRPGEPRALRKSVLRNPSPRSGETFSHRAVAASRQAVCKSPLPPWRRCVPSAIERISRRKLVTVLGDALPATPSIAFAMWRVDDANIP